MKLKFVLPEILQNRGQGEADLKGQILTEETKGIRAIKEFLLADNVKEVDLTVNSFYKS